MIKESEIEKNILGVLLTCSPKQGLEYLSQVKEHHFENGFHQDVFKVCRKLIISGKHADLPSVFEELRGKPGFNVQRLSQLSASAPVLPHHIDASMSAIRRVYNKRMVTNFVLRSQRGIENDSLSLDAFLADIDGLKKQIDYGEDPDRSTREIAMDVLDQHDKAKSGEMTGLSLGHGAIADIVSLEPVDVMVVPARPGMGKTAFAISVAKNLAFNQNKKIAFFGIEMSDVQLTRRLMAAVTRIGANKMKKGNLTDHDKEKYLAAHKREELDNIHIFTGPHTVDDIYLKCVKLKNSTGLDLIVIDYVQKVTSTLPASAGNTASIKQVSDDLKAMTQVLKVPQLQGAQLTKSASKDGARPRLSDIRDTAAIEENASVIGFLYRPAHYGIETMPDGRSSKGICEMIIAKNREDGLGTREFIADLWCSDFRSNAATSGQPKTPDGEQDDLPF